MDFQKKSDKYYQKLNIGGIAKKYTKDIFDKLSIEEQNEFPFYCKDDKPYLCSLESKNYGLCKEKPINCTNYTGENTYLTYDLTPDRQALYNYGKDYGGYDIFGSDNKDCSK